MFRASLAVVAVVSMVAVALMIGPLAGAEEPSGPLSDGGAVSSADAEIEAVPVLGGGPTVYISTGLNFPDALGAGPAAALAHGPILLVQQNAIPPETLAELNRLNPSKAFIVGGTGVVSAAVEAQIAALVPEVVRLAGTNRYATAVEVSKESFPHQPTIRGDYALYLGASDSNDGAAEGHSFGGYTFATAPTDHWIADGDTPPADCPGSPANPQANPGHLCVYEVANFNIGTQCIAEITDTQWICGSADEFGFTLFVTAAGAGFAAWTAGSWAATPNS
jgi:hypothetical protein